MSPAAGIHAQLASIMEVLANAAVAEICELVDSGYSVLQLEITRSRKENEALRRKLRLMELRAARASALRAAVATASGAALLHASGGRARPQVFVGGEASRRSGTTGQAALSRSSNQEPPQVRDPGPPSEQEQEVTQRRSAGETSTVIKVEDDDESWSRSEADSFCLVVEGQTDSSPSRQVKQEAAGDGGGGGGGGVSSRSWTSGEVSSTSTSGQKSLNTSQRTETSLVFELHLQQHGSLSTTHNPLGADPSCSSALTQTVSGDSGGGCGGGGGGSFPFTLGEGSVSAERQQRAPPADEQLPAAGGQTGGWRHQDGGSRDDPGGKSFVCNRCGKTLACLKNLKTHMRVHTGEKPFVCSLCGKRFSDSSNLKRHQSVHTGEKRYGCVHCGKRFAQSGSLKVHMSVHTDCKQFRCLYCSKTFISISHLKRHVSVHGGQRGVDL